VIRLPVALLIERFGWRAAWLALAAIVLVLGLAATAAMRRRPEDGGLAPDGVASPHAGRATGDTPDERDQSLGAPRGNAHAGVLAAGAQHQSRRPRLFGVTSISFPSSPTAGCPRGWRRRW